MSSSTTGRRLALMGALCVASITGRAEAFRLPTNFNQSAAVGGSGGRYFTGSPTDRYTCKVCHVSVAPPQIQITGLPFAGYTPGQTYAFLIDWDDTLPSVAYNIEMTDGAGHAFGTFSLPPDSALAPAELCGPKAGATILPGPERTLAILPECGAHQSTILWTAPAPTQDASGRLTAPEAWFSGSLLVSDKDGSVAGDAVMDLSHVFGPLGETPPVATRIDGGCSVSVAAPRFGHWLASVSYLLVGAFLLRRGRRRTSS